MSRRQSAQKQTMLSLSDDEEDDLPELSELLANLRVPRHLSPSKSTSSAPPPTLSKPCGHGAVRRRKPGLDSVTDSSSLLLLPSITQTSPPRPVRAVQRPISRRQTPTKAVQAAKGAPQSTTAANGDTGNETKAKKWDWGWDLESDECVDEWQEEENEDEDDSHSDSYDNSVESDCDDIEADTAAPLRKPVTSDRTSRTRRSAHGPSRQLEKEIKMAASSKDKAAGTDAKMTMTSSAKTRAAAEPMPSGTSQVTTELSTNEPDDFFTPPSTPQKMPRRDRIPQTPHGPETDLFWSKDFIDDWNDQHSPLKPIILPDAKKPRSRADKGKKRGTKTTAAAATTTAADSQESRKASKKEFDASKSAVAEAFLKELDDTITMGKLAELSASTGGVGLVWTNKLNTTAGRAHWRLETTRIIGSDGSVTSTTFKHHAHIDIATKVIDDELRLLNVIAHEFCHLATFMVTGVATNPHGKEFKEWASKCSRHFGHRGVDVTTKHTYDIDFKYVWECVECGLEYKRHSKSINLDNSRCGRCRGGLKQTKPIPRATTGKPTKYQEFVKEQMKAIRAETPGITQKDLMKVVARKWAAAGARNPETTPPEGNPPRNIVSRLGAIIL